MQLLLWAERPEIKERIEQMKALRKLAVESAQDSARLIAIDTLKDLARNAKDPTDRRRAASTLMRRYESQLRPPHGWHGQRAAPGESAVPIPAASNPTCGHRSQPLPEGGEGEGFSSHSALSPEPSALPPPRPPSTATAAKIANILLKSGSLPYALEDINHLKHPEATIFGTPVPPTSSSSWTSSPPAPSRTSSPPPRAT